MQEQRDTGEHLLKKLRKGDKAAFEIFYHQEYITVLYTAQRFVADIQAAEDLTTEVFLKLWERLSNFDSLPAMRSFLFVSIKNACLNYLRSEKRASAQYQELSYLLEQDSSEGIANQQLMAAIYRYLYEEIEKLPPQLKRVFKMAYIGGLSNEAIAAELGINNQSVRNDKSRALKQLRLASESWDLFGLLLLCLKIKSL
ncbi:RNA polymerase sigma factor [Chitinophaga defluvii]|uniref:Sigma-70 family RNA polymerase sigma factor n=1 Tax=Chitinophaga defluvii TaxID=3163343 RepID=A0ABV2TBF4_9BACT